MPPDLDPAYAAFRPVRRESPTEGMRRIERNLRSDDFEYRDRPRTQPGSLGSNAGRSLEGYNASIGAQGPLSAGLIGAGDPETGKPQMVGGRVQAGPLSYQYTQPTFKGAPAGQQVGVSVPFDADSYFGVSAQQTPGQGRTYGANVGGDGWNVSGGYNPTSKSVNANVGYQANFAGGGPVTPQMLAAQMIPPEEQNMIEGEHAGSPSFEGVGKVMGTVGQGFPGGSGKRFNTSGDNCHWGGGGGGAGGVGMTCPDERTSPTQEVMGGPGAATDIFGDILYFGGGGGGGAHHGGGHCNGGIGGGGGGSVHHASPYPNRPGTGYRGNGGGQSLNTGQTAVSQPKGGAGGANTGGGGGGADNGGAGGSGVVVVRY
jgi:hypothetical protein